MPQDSALDLAPSEAKVSLSGDRTPIVLLTVGDRDLHAVSLDASDIGRPVISHGSEILAVAIPHRGNMVVRNHCTLFLDDSA